MAAPEELRDSGRALWEGCQADTLPAPQRVLVLQAARLADRLDRLAEILNGDRDSWVTIASHEEGDDIKVVVDNALGQARLHAVTFSGLIGQLRATGVLTSGEVGSAPDKPQEGIDELERKRKQREEEIARAIAAGR